MMAAKARLSGDAEAVEKILAAPHPGAAKALGQMLPEATGSGQGARGQGLAAVPGGGCSAGEARRFVREL